MPEDRQDILAKLMLHKIDEDEKWARSTEANADKLRGLIGEVLQADSRGECDRSAWIACNLMNSPIDHYRSILREQLPALRSRWGVASLEIFGSRARGEARSDSDLDVLVTLEKPIGLFQFVELEASLTKLLGVKVDLVLRSALKPKIGERILAEAVPV